MIKDWGEADMLNFMLEISHSLCEYCAFNPYDCYEKTGRKPCDKGVEKWLKRSY